MLPKVINIEKNIYSVIRESMEYQKISWQTMADKISLSRMGLFKSFKNETLTISTMLAMCEVLNINAVDLFQVDSFVSEPAPEYLTPAQAVKNRLQEVHRLCAEIEEICTASKAAAKK